MLVQTPSPRTPHGGTTAGSALTAVLVDADWVVERWVLGTGHEAREWPVAGESFWDLTVGRIPVDAAALLRLAMDGRRPDLFRMVDPLTQDPVRTIVTPTSDGLTIVFQPETEPAAARPGPVVDPAGPGATSPVEQLPGWLREPFRELVACPTVDELVRVAIPHLVRFGRSPRVSVGLISGERLLIVNHTGYGLIDLIRPLADPGLGRAIQTGQPVRVRSGEPVTWMADDSRVAIHAPFRHGPGGGPIGILTVEWTNPEGGSDQDRDRIAAFATCLGLAITEGPLVGALPPPESLPLASVPASQPGSGPGLGTGSLAGSTPGQTEGTGSGPMVPRRVPGLPTPNRNEALKTRRWDPGSACWVISGMSDRITELSGFPVEALLADPDLWSSRVHPEDRTLARTSQALAPEVGQRSEVVYRFQHRDGAWRLFQEDAVVFRDAEDALVNALLISDVTDQQHTVDLLRESELRYRSLVDDLPGIVAYIREYDPRHGTLRTTYISPEVETLTGISAEHWVRDNLAIASMVHPDDLERITLAATAVVDRHTDYTHEYRIIRPDGQVRWLRNRVKSIARSAIDGGEVDRWHGVMIDITPQREAELALRDREARFRLLVEQSPSATLYTQQVNPVTGERTTSYLSPQVATLTGYAPGDDAVRQPPFLPIVHPDDLHLFRAESTADLLGPGRASLDYRIIHRDGRVRWLRNMVERDADRAANGSSTWRGIVIDISDQRAAEERGRAQDARMRSIVEQSSEILVITDRNGIASFVSPALETVLGYPLDQAARLTVRDIVHPDHLAGMEDALRRIRASPGNRFSGIRVKASHADGGWRWLEISAINKEDRPEIGGVVITARDVTDQVLADEALRFRESLLGTLVRHAADFIVVLDPGLVITYASPSAHGFLVQTGATAPSVVESCIFDEEDGTRFRSELHRLDGHPGAAAHFESRIRRADGQWRWIRMVITNHTGTPGIDGFLINAHDMTDYRDAEKRLRESEDRFRALFRHAPDIVMVLDPDGCVQFASPSAELALGDSLSHLVGHDTPLAFHPDDSGMAIAQFDRALERPSEAVSFEARVRHRSGDWLWWEITVTNLLAHASVGGLVLNARDVTWRREAEARLRESEERFRLLVQHGSDLTMLVAGDGTISFVTPSSMRILGFAPTEIEGRTDFDWISRIDRPRFDDLLDQSRRRPEPAGPIVVSFHHADGSCRDLQIIATSLLDNHAVRGIVINAHDVTERRTLEQQLLHQAFHDPLTGLPNRALFNERLAEARKRALQNRTSFAVIFLDLDDFKVVNDTLGHSAGDQLLRTVADRLGTAARGVDTIARMGGDEFTILIEELRDHGSAETFADRVIERLREPVTINGHELLVSPSLGIAIGLPDDDEEHDLLREADIAMYEAKARGKGQRVVYDERMNARAWARMEAQGDLRQTTADG